MVGGWEQSPGMNPPSVPSTLHISSLGLSFFICKLGFYNKTYLPGAWRNQGATCMGHLMQGVLRKPRLLEDHDLATWGGAYQCVTETTGACLLSLTHMPLLGASHRDDGRVQ